MALLTTTDGNIEASPEGCAHDFLLVLRFDPLDLQRASTLTLRRRWYRDDFVDFGGNGFAVPLTVGGTGLASGGLRILFAGAPRKRCGLSLVGPLRFFQLSLQLFVLLPQSFSFRNCSISRRAPRHRSCSEATFCFHSRRVAIGSKAMQFPYALSQLTVTK